MIELIRIETTGFYLLVQIFQLHTCRSKIRFKFSKAVNLDIDL